MLWLSEFFNHPGLTAFTTDSSVDYTLDEKVPYLDNEKRAEISRMIGGSLATLAWVKQIHGAGVMVVDEEFISDQSLKEADALVSHLKDVLIAVRTADCLPVFIWDPVHKIMAVVHAGWKSTHKQIVRHTIDVMTKRYHTECKDLKIAFGPAIRSCCYQVSDEFQEYFPDSVVLRDGQLFMDLIKANLGQLTSLGVNFKEVHDSQVCTMCDPGYFSFRRDSQKAGRMISAMILKG